MRMHQTRPGTEESASFKKDRFTDTEKRFTDFTEVCTEIERRTEQRTNNSKNISREEIQLDIFSPHYPDLQFVDLPGFTKTAVRNQDADIEQQILDLNLPYMRDENTIILAIQDSKDDIGISEALKRALSPDVDPEGDRTIGVLTKLDNLVSVTDRKRVADILMNKTKPLKLGYIGVVNRTQEEIDTGAAVEVSRENEKRTMEQPEFRRLKARVGISVLRRRITKILAEKVKKLLPSLKQDTEDELKYIRSELQQHGLHEDDNVDKDELIAKLMEMAVSKIRINLEGFDIRVDSEDLNTGFALNELLKKGAVEASRAARQAESVHEFHKRLVDNLKKIRGIRDHIFPDQLVLEIGVAILTENYRLPFGSLLQESINVLTRNVIAALEVTLGAFPHFKDLVQTILLEEVEKNKSKAEEYLDVQIDIHKRFINSEHREFSKLNKNLRNNGIRYKNHFDLWFKESVPTSKMNQTEANNEGERADHDDYEDEEVDAENIFDNTSDIAGSAATGLIDGAVKAVRGFVERLQNKPENNVHTNKLPSMKEHEAMLHMDLCLEYMEIVDKALVDEVPKIFIMMLVMRTLDFLNGGKRGITDKDTKINVILIYSEQEKPALLVLHAEGGTEEDQGARGQRSAGQKKSGSREQDQVKKSFLFLS